MRANNENRCSSLKFEQVVIGVEEGSVVMKSQLQEYINRPLSLETYNVIEFFTNMYKKHKSHDEAMETSTHTT